MFLLFSQWPLGRGIYHNEDRSLAVWINESDHVIVKAIEHRGRIRQSSQKIKDFLGRLSALLVFARDPAYGFLSVHPACLGSGLELNVVTSLPQLAQNYAKLKELCRRYGIQVRRQRHCLFDLVNTNKMGRTEFQILVGFFNGVREILEFEKSLP